MGPATNCGKNATNTAKFIKLVSTSVFFVIDIKGITHGLKRKKGYPYW